MHRVDHTCAAPQRGEPADESRLGKMRVHDVEVLAPQQSAKRKARAQIVEWSERATERRNTMNTNSGRNRDRFRVFVPVREMYIMTGLAEAIQRMRDVAFGAASQPMSRRVKYLHDTRPRSGRAYPRIGWTPSSAYTLAILATVASGAKRCRTMLMP